MSDVKGKIGQAYENRKTKKAGVLIEKNEQKRQYLLQDENGEVFAVSFGSFKSNWRKSNVDISTPIVPAEDVVPAVEEEPEVPKLRGIEGLNDFINSIQDMRHVEFSHDPVKADATTLAIDGVPVLTMCKDDGGIRMTVLPDLYTYSEIKEHVIAGTLRFNNEGHMCVAFVSDYEDFGEIVQAVKQAVIDLNLYGYTLTD